MTIQQFQYILEVYRAGSVSQAAKNLFVGQSSVSLSITNLEKELGYPIFHRSKNGVTPTRRGMEVIEHAARICESCRIISAPSRSDCAQLRIGVGGFEVARRAVSRLLAENRDRRDLAFSFLQMSQSEQIRQLSLFELDMSLCFVFAPRIRQLEARLRAKGLQWQELTKFPAAIQLGPGHRLYHAEHVEVAMLEEDWLIDTASKSMANSPYFNTMIQVSPDRVLTVSNPQLRAQLLREGLGYCIGPAAPHTPDDLRRIPLENVQLKLLALFNPLRPMRPEVQRYLELLREELANAALQ